MLECTYLPLSIHKCMCGAMHSRENVPNVYKHEYFYAVRSVTSACMTDYIYLYYILYTCIVCAVVLVVQHTLTRTPLNISFVKSRIIFYILLCIAPCTADGKY